MALRNEKGEEISRLRTGKDVTLVFSFQNKTNRALRNFHLAVGVDDKTGQRVTLFSNEITGEIFMNVPPDSDRIELSIPRVPLMPGRYVFTIYCTLNGIVADWIQSAGFFDVEEGDFYDTGRLPALEQGNFLVSHHFRIPKSD